MTPVAVGAAPAARKKTEQEFRWDASGPVQTLKGGDIALRFKNGEQREVSFVTHPPRWHLKGGGYGGYRGWYHGDHKGEYYCQHDVWDLSDPAVLAEASTLSDHLIEVASSDRHTVKPWLSARLDYSPPVQDLANEGFALIGGRLDYLERHPVATLVYRYRQHTIDVFVRPETSHAPMSALRAVRGFNVARASGPSMDWLAVSDAEPAVLSAFVERLSREEITQ